MRRTIAAGVVALSTALPVITASTSSATDGKATPLAPTEGVAAQRAERALGTAQEVLSGSTGSRPDQRPEATLAMRDLFMSLPDLDAGQRKQAGSVLARPTDGANDQYGDGYTVPAKKSCKGNFCIHWVDSTADAATTAWALRTRSVMNSVWSHHVGKMGYRKPVSDGTRGGNGKFDVYLKDLGNQGLYGYCAPERRKPGYKWLASGYCVLDNDFASSQYGAPPLYSLRVTAAHEFFHAVQFAYDYGEDKWFMETTATWMEERYADNVNDNRQYLPYGQVKKAGSPLDFFNDQGFNQYGNWPFFEYLSTHYGNGVVRKIWNKAGAFKGAPDLYSTKAVKAVLRTRGGFAGVFRKYAAGNTMPGRTYPEGSAWPKAVIAKRWTLTRDQRRAANKFSIDHLSSQNARVTPGTSLKGKRWMLRVTVDAPGQASGPGVYLLVRKKSGKVVKQAVKLTSGGYGKVKVPFSSSGVSSVTVTLANASTRFKCWRNPATAYTCGGRPLDNDKPFRLKVAAFKR